MNETAKYIAKCYQIIDLGTPKSVCEKSERRKILINWEAHPLEHHGSSITPVDTFTTCKIYELTLESLSPLQLDSQAMMQSKLSIMDLNRFNIKELLSTFCILRLEDIDSKEIISIEPVEDLSTCNAFVSKHKPSIFYIAEPDMVLLNSLPVKIQDMVRSSWEWDAEFETQNVN